MAKLNDGLVDLDERAWNVALSNLRDCGLLAKEDGTDLDAHPLVRAWFGHELERRHPSAWQAGHERLYEHFKNAAPELPDTLDEMMPLYAAVVHGCRAGKHKGIGLMTKHSVLFFGFGLVVALVLTPARRHLRSPWLFAGGALAGLIVLPNVLWQIANDWQTLQFVRQINENTMGGISPVQFLAGQVLYLGPASAPVWLAGLAFFFMTRTRPALPSAGLDLCRGARPAGDGEEQNLLPVAGLSPAPGRRRRDV